MAYIAGVSIDDEWIDKETDPNWVCSETDEYGGCILGTYTFTNVDANHTIAVSFNSYS
jgi:hypothetical protein